MINGYLSVPKSQKHPFLFISDEGGTHCSSTTSRINELRRIYTNLTDDDIVLVVPEI